MPLVAIRVGLPSSGRSEIKLMEYLPGIDYKKVLKFLNTKVSPTTCMSKDELSRLLSFCHCRRERESLTYAVYKASGLSKSAARKHFGLENLAKRTEAVEEAIEEAQTMKECIDSLCLTQQQAMLRTLGIHVSSDSESSSSKVEEYSSPESGETLLHLPPEETVQHLKAASFNWFEFLDRMEELYMYGSEGDKEDHLEHMYSDVINSDYLQSGEKALLEQSHSAYLVDSQTRLRTDQREADAFNGLIVPDSDTDDAEDYVGLDNLVSDRVKTIVSKCTKAIRRHGRYLKAKWLAEQNFLARKSSQQLCGIVQTCPNIGEIIEDFVQENNIGADAWRRTGVLTFDGTSKIGKKVTFERI